MSEHSDELAGILVLVDGEPVDLSQVSWIHVAPCGCTAGVTIGYSAAFGRSRAHIITTAEQAAERFADSRAEREQNAARGFTVKPIHRRDLDNMECHHNPKWGYDRHPKPEGCEWARGGYYGRYTSVLHLVPAKSVVDDDVMPQRDDWTATALCGIRKNAWTKRWHELLGIVECKRCIKEANRG